MQNGQIHFDMLTDRYQGTNHAILIDPFDDDMLLEILQAGMYAYLDARARETPPAVASRWIRDVVKYDGHACDRLHQRHSRDNPPKLGEFVQAARCREKNLFLHLLLAQLGYPSEYWMGYVRVNGKTDTHACLYLPMTGEIADGVAGCFMPVDDYCNKFGFEYDFFAGPPKILARPHHHIWNYAGLQPPVDFGFARE